MALSTTALYVGDLHPDVTEGTLYEKFSTIGPVLSLRVCRDAITRRSLGYAYVNYQQPEDAESALDTLNFDLMNGLPMRIMWSQRNPSVRRFGVGNLFIKNLDKTIDNKSMYDTFSAFGNILSCKIVLDENGDSMGYGFIHFDTEEAANRAIEKVNGMLLNQKKVYVGKFIPRTERVKPEVPKPTTFTNLYVKHMADMTESKLLEVFSEFGKINSCVVMRNTQGLSRGFGFVDFESPESAKAAVEALNRKELDGRLLYVAKAQKKSDRRVELKQRYDDVQNDRFKRNDGVNLFLKNLDDDVDDNCLYEEFSRFGVISSAKVMTENGRSKGFGFVCYTTEEEANKAITEMHGKVFGTKPLYIALAQRKDERKAFLAARLQRIRIQPNVYPTAPPFVIPAIVQTPRIYAVNHLREAPRWAVYPGTMRVNAPYPMFNNTFLRVGARSSQSLNERRSVTEVRPIALSPMIIRSAATSPPSTPESNNGREESSGNAGSFASASLREQKRLLGKKLLPLVKKMCPQKGKQITGMLLRVDASELIHMLDNRSFLREKVDEALTVIRVQQRAVQQQRAAGNPRTASTH